MQHQGSLITIRTHQIMRQYERISIQIDGKQAGEIGNNDEIQIPVLDGTHVITSKGLWGTKVYPLHLTILDHKEIEITIDQIPGKSKFQFIVETNLPQADLMNEYNFISRKLAWDLGGETSILKTDDSTIQFDLTNSSFPRPLHFVINVEKQNLKVYASKKQNLLLYESDVNMIDALAYPYIMLENIIEHTFYRVDGTLLGFLTLENSKWIISSKRQEKIAEICLKNTRDNQFNQQDHYLKSLQNDNGTLALKKWDHQNNLQFQIINIPDKEYNEILLLAFVTYSALVWGKVSAYAVERIPVRF